MKNVIVELLRNVLKRCRTTKKHWRSAGFRRTSVQERQTEAKSFFNEVNLLKKTKLKSFLRIIFLAFQFGFSAPHFANALLAAVQIELTFNFSQFLIFFILILEFKFYSFELKKCILFATQIYLIYLSFSI